jgi:hypothetical protein
MFTCCDIPAYLSSFPETWRNELSEVLCKMYQPTADNFMCETVKGCETKTTIDTFSLNPSTHVLTLTYMGESGVAQTKTVDLSGIIPATITADNGLTKTLNNIQLGGSLLHNTTLTLSTFNLILTGSGIVFTSFPNSRSDANPINFLFTTNTGLLQSGNLATNVQNITNSYLNTIFNTAVGSQVACLDPNWATLSFEDKMKNLMDIIKQLCSCCGAPQTTCSFTAAAIKQ